MIDFLKILITDNTLITELYNNNLLDDYSMYQKLNSHIKSNHNERTQARHTKTYKGILFCFYEHKLEILFKPHYYYNDNIHNANDFNTSNCIKTLLEIRYIFNMPPEKLLIINIEFGINAISPIDCKDLISYTVYHNKNVFLNTNDQLRYSKISLKHGSRNNNYKMIKFYAKGVQFPQHTNINTFRFEIKSKRSKYINGLSIYTYSDLLISENYNQLSQHILLEFNNVLILDINNNRKNLTTKESKKIEHYNNPINWDKALQKSRNTFNNQKKRYLNLLDKTENNIHRKLESIISKKLKQLTETCAVSAPLYDTKNCAVSGSNIIGNRTNNSVEVTQL